MGERREVLTEVNEAKKPDWGRRVKLAVAMIDFHRGAENQTSKQITAAVAVERSGHSCLV